MRSLLYLPIPVSFLVVVSVSAAIALIGLKIARRKFSPEMLKENHEVAGFIFNAFGLIYAVLIAFVVYATWSDFNDAKTNAEMEANKMADLYMDAFGLPDSNRIIIQNKLLEYAFILKDDEWPQMEHGQKSLTAREALEKIFTEYLKMDVKNIPNPYIYQESMKRLNELSEFRRMRLLSSTNNIPGVIWFVVIIGAVISIGYTYIFGTRSLTAQYVMTAALAVTNSLVLFLIYILDNPFTGSNKIEPEALQEAIELFKHFMR